jgi:hypothetical protein
MKQGFFFDGIDMPCNELIIHQGLQDSGLVFPDTADSPAPCFDNASMAAKDALYLIFIKRLVQISFHNRFAPLRNNGILEYWNNEK